MQHTRTPSPQPVQNSPNNTPPGPQPVQNSPSNTQQRPHRLQPQQKPTSTSNELHRCCARLSKLKALNANAGYAACPVLAPSTEASCDKDIGSQTQLSSSLPLPLGSDTGPITGIAHDFGRATPSLKEKPPTHTPTRTHLKEKPPTQRENRAKSAIFSACGRKRFHFPVGTPTTCRAGAIKVSFTVSTSHRHCFAAPSLRNNPLTRPGKPTTHRT